MCNTVVIGIDGSDADSDAVALALTLAPEHDRFVLANVCRVVHPPVGGSPARSATDDRVHSLKLLDSQRARLVQSARTVCVVAASVGAGLQTVAQHEGADLIVVGGSHHTSDERSRDGDDALTAVHHTARPIAVTSPGYADDRHGLRRIGIAYDDSAGSRLAILEARRLATIYDASVTVRNVTMLPLGAGLQCDDEVNSSGRRNA
jgi:nucleotide-binding universal stress UspA family protein